MPLNEPGGVMKLICSAIGILLLVGLFPAHSTATAQGVGTSADLNGTVTDPTGAGVPNAKITVTDPEKGVERTAITDEHGLYRVSGLPPATYKVSVEHAGFQAEVRSEEHTSEL